MSDVTRAIIGNALREYLKDVPSESIALISRRIHIEMSHGDDYIKDDDSMMHLIEMVRTQCEEVDARNILNQFLNSMPIPHLAAKVVQNCMPYIYNQGFKAGAKTNIDSWKAKEDAT